MSVVPHLHAARAWALATRERARTAAVGAEGRLGDSDAADHPMITQPEKVTRALVQVAGG